MCGGAAVLPRDQSAGTLCHAHRLHTPNPERARDPRWLKGAAQGAVRATFGDAALVQRCQVHKMRNILDYSTIGSDPAHRPFCDASTECGTEDGATPVTRSPGARRWSIPVPPRV